MQLNHHIAKYWIVQIQQRLDQKNKRDHETNQNHSIGYPETAVQGVIPGEFKYHTSRPIE